jgi:hypothetical protein
VAAAAATLNWRDNARSWLDQLLQFRDFEVGTIERTRNGGTVLEQREISHADKEAERGCFVHDGFGIFVFSLPFRSINQIHCL